MSTLTGNKISLTYKSLFKTSDNDVLTAALKQMSDGLGNNSGVYLNTGGDLKSTGTLEFANFKGTSTAVTINKLVNEADGISNNDNDTSLPTSAAVKDYVDTHVTSQDLDFSDGTTQSAIDLDSQVFAIVGTTNEIETTASGQQLQIGLPNSVTISGTYTGATFSGDLNGTINTATTATTQSAGDNSTKVATTAYVDTLDAASDLDFSGTTGTGDVNLNTQTFAVTGTTNQITTAASNQGLQISLLSTGVTMPNNSVATTQSAGDNSTKLATTAYVDVLDAASDLDIAGDSGTGDVNLNTQTFTLSGTTNQVTTAVSGQTATFSLPSTIHRNLQGNVTGDLTGNADTATKWQTARNLSVSGEATGTISNVDGSSAVSGAVTLTNSAVIGKVLTGLPTPAAGNIQASDSILEAFGKLQSQVSSISNGLIFKGSWDADTNTPTLTSGGGEVESGTTDGATTAFKLIDSSQNFNTTVSIGNKVINQVDGTTALVTVIDSNTQLTLDTNIMLTGEAYTIDASPFIPQGNYYVVNYAGNTNLNGTTDWSIGDWVIADADNRWSKLDHSQVDGQGSPGHLPVFATATTIGDSIVSQVGTALTITGSATTTLGLSSTGNFAVNTNKFTANSTTGNVAFPGDLAINTNKFTVNATSGNTVVAGTGTFGGAVRINATTTTGLVIASQSGASNGLKLYNNSTTDNAYIYNHFDGNLEIGTNNATVLTMNGTNSTFAGNVGIGEDSPDFLVDAKKGYASGDGKVAKFRAGNDATFVQFDTVQVVQSDVPCLAIIETSTGTQSDEQKLTFSAGDTRAIIGTSTTVTDGMSFYVNRAVTAHGYAVTGTKALHLQNNGNATFAGNVNIKLGSLSIGESSEQNISNITGETWIGSNGLRYNSGSDTFARSSATAQAAMMVLTTTADVEFYAQPSTSQTGTYALSPKMVIKGATGNVGIGTASPDYTLHLLKSSGDTEMYINGQNGQSSLRMGLDVRNWQIKTAAAPYLWSLNYVGTDFQTPNIITATTGGNVGIGTDLPASAFGFSKTLEIQGAANAEVNISQSANSKDWSLGITNGANYQQTTSGQSYVWESGGTERMRILANGNIAFNATSNLNASKFQISTASGLGANVDVFIANTSGTPYVNSATTTQLSMGFLSGTANYVATGQRLGALQFFGQASDAGYGAGAIKSVVTTGGNVGRSSHAAGLIFETKAAGSLGNVERMRLNSKGVLSVKSNDTNQASFEQTLAISRGLSAAGTVIPIAYVDHTHALDVTVIIKQNTSNVASGKGHSICAYGTANTGMTTVAGSGNVTGITLAYLNTNPSGQDYVLTLTWAGSGASPDAYITIRGNSTGAICEY